MAGIDTQSGVDLFSGLSAVAQQIQVESLSQSALNSGITKYTNGDYAGAAKEFSRSFGLSPQGPYSRTAAEYMSKAYQQMGEYDKAVNAYQKIIDMNPADSELRTNFGNLLFGLGRTEEAETQYREAYRIDGGPKSRFSLAQAQMANGKYASAKDQFDSIIAMDPTASQGYYGLGQALAKMGDYEASVQALERATTIDPEFYDAWAELGYTYADKGEIDQAEQIFTFLNKKGERGLADTLSRYLYEKSSPKIETVMSESTFRYSLPAKTPVAALSSYLAAPGGEKSFTMKFMFDKEMDADSVQNRYNWMIGRSGFTGAGERYNNGLPVASTEVDVPMFPENVVYDTRSFTATVTFRIGQLASSVTGTIDPSHMVFKFSGTDAYGNAMDIHADQYAYATGVR